jgi:hypothetical protein
VYRGAYINYAQQLLGWLADLRAPPPLSEAEARAASWSEWAGAPAPRLRAAVPRLRPARGRGGALPPPSPPRAPPAHAGDAADAIEAVARALGCTR